MINSQKAIATLIFSALAGFLAAFLFLRLAPFLPSYSPISVLNTIGVQHPTVMGFVPYWLIAKAQPESLDKLNSLTYFGLTIDVDGTLIEQTNPQETEPGWQSLKTDRYTKLIKDRSVESSLLLHLSNEASISALLTQPELHATNLVTSVEPLMKKYNFTDLNLDIESFKTASPSAQAQMSTFLRQVKQGMTEKKLGTLTTELTVASLIKPQLLNPQVVGEVSDRVVLMAYDFTYTGSTVAGPVAPVGGAQQKWEYDVLESVKLATAIIPSHKILLGIPLYGYEWETLSYQPESPVVPGTGKTATTARVQELLTTCSQCITGREALSDTPYIILPPNEDSSIQQIYYEDTISLQKKLKLAQDYKLGGVALWAIGYESTDLLQPLDEYRKSIVGSEAK